MKKIKNGSQGSPRRKKLLDASVVVFSEKGYVAASFSDITKIAGARPSALTYYFGTKKNLFQETLQYAILENAKLVSVFDSFASADPKKPETLSKALHESIRNLIYICHKPGLKVPHIRGLLLANIANGGVESNRTVQKLAHATMKNVFILLLEWNPKLTETEIYWWSHMFWSLIFYSTFGEMFLLSASTEDKFSEDFIESLISRTTIASCTLIGLPVPEMRDNWQIKQ